MIKSKYDQNHLDEIAESDFPKKPVVAFEPDQDWLEVKRVIDHKEVKAPLLLHRALATLTRLPHLHSMKAPASQLVNKDSHIVFAKWV